MPTIKSKIEKTITDLNREAWLTEVARRIEPVFKGYKIAPYRVTCGWPSHSALGMRRRVIGQCFGAEHSTGKVHELFISPTLDKPLDVAGTLTHEMTHIVAGVKDNHGPMFQKLCKIIGLTKGKPTTAGPGEVLAAQLDKIIGKVGDYPHQAIVPVAKKVKPSGSVSLVCPACECRISISTKWLDQAGLPTCGCGVEMKEKERKEG